MKKCIKNLMSLSMVFTMVGCGSKVSSSSSNNKTSSSSSVIKTKEELNKEFIEELESKMDVVDTKVDAILDNDLVSYETSSTEKSVLTLISEEETVEVLNSEGTSYSVSNVDMVAGKAYYDEYLTRTEDEEGNVIYDKELVASIASIDTSSSYSKTETINHLVDEESNKYTYKNDVETWLYPTKSYVITNEEYDPSDYGENTSIYEYSDITTDEDYYMNNYLVYYALEEGKILLNSDNSELKESIFYKFLNKEATSKEVVDYLVESYDEIASEIPEDIDIGFDFIKDTNYQNMMIVVLNEIQDIDYYSLFTSSVTKNGNKETYTIKLDLEALIDTTRDIVDAFERGLSFIPEEDENKATLNTLVDLINDDLKNRVPTTFDVSSSIHFEDDMIVGYDSTTKINGLLPYTLGIFVFGASDLEVLDNTVINVDITTSTEFKLGNTYINIPSVDESKFN